MKKKAEEIIMENLESIEKWALIGLTQREIAERLNVGYSTFRKLKGQKYELLALFEKSVLLKIPEDNGRVKKVEKSLYQRAKGYNYEILENIKVKSSGYDENGKKWEKEEVVQKPKEIHVPADIQAAKFYLMNRDRRNWNENPNKIEMDKEVLKLRKKESENKEW